MILGLTGSLGSGKSTVADMLAEMAGAVVIDADAIARRALEPGGGAFEAVVEEFGSGIVGPDQTIDRAKLATLVFSDPEKLQRLNSIVHPVVRSEEMGLLEKHRGSPLVVLVIPLLFENGLESHADKVVVVTVDEPQRVERLWKRSAMPAVEVERRLAAQMPQARKAALADFVVDNSGTPQATREQVGRLIGQLGL